MDVLIYAFTADLMFGDPEWFFHPVRIIGAFIKFVEKLLRNKNNNKFLSRLKGIVLAVIVIGTTVVTVYFLVWFLKRISPFWGKLCLVYIGYTSLAMTDLRLKAKAIYKKLKENEIDHARKELAKIVGRDTCLLNGEKITLAAIESIAENTNDGIIAPLFFFILGGPLAALCYKTINTLDSMIGYKNEKYLEFGWFSARLDDIVNFVPARISGCLISFSSFLLGKGFKNSFKIMLRDGRKHASPNSGISEAAMAGALGISLGGGACYGGEFLNRPFIGEEREKIIPEFITEAVKIIWLTSFLMFFIGAAVKWAL